MIKAFRDLLTSVDMLNTINGGISEPYVSFREQSEAREIRVRVPGVSKEYIQVEVHNNELAVFYLIPMTTTGKLVHMPQIVFKQQMPYYINIAAINATYEENQLVVKLPFNELSNGYNKKIEIDEA